MSIFTLPLFLHLSLFSLLSILTCLSSYISLSSHVSRLFFSSFLRIFLCLALSSYDLSLSLFSSLSQRLVHSGSCAENTYPEGWSAWALALHWLANCSLRAEISCLCVPAVLCVVWCRVVLCGVVSCGVVLCVSLCVLCVVCFSCLALKDAPACTFNKTLPCVLSKRPRHTGHGVLNAHTGAF